MNHILSSKNTSKIFNKARTMFLQRPNREFPELVELFQNYCDANNIHYLDAEYESFVDFFFTNGINIRVEEREDTYLAESIKYGAKQGQNNPLQKEINEERRNAEYEAVYLGYRMLDQFGNN